MEQESLNKSNVLYLPSVCESVHKRKLGFFTSVHRELVPYSLPTVIAMLFEWHAGKAN